MKLSSILFLSLFFTSLHAQVTFSNLNAVLQDSVELDNALQKMQWQEVNILADTLITANKHAEAMILTRQSTDMAARKYGKDAEEYVQALELAGVAYEKGRQYDKAIFFFDKAAQITKEKRQAENADYARLLHRLGTVYHRKRDFNTAENLYLEASSIRKKVLGDAHEDYANTMNNMAILYNQTAKYDKAEACFKKVANAREKILGKEHLDYANTLIGLGALYIYTERYEEAEKLFWEVLAIREKKLGNEHVDCAHAIMNLGVIYHHTSQYTLAEEHLIKAKNIYAKTVGTKSIDYAKVLVNLGTVYMSTSQYEIAEKVNLEARGIYQNRLGAQHPYYATIVHNIALLYREMGEFGKAEVLTKEAKHIREKTIGEKHPDYHRTLLQLASLYVSMGRYEPAEKLYKKTQTLITETYGKENTSYATTLMGLGALYSRMKRYDIAENVFREAQEVYAKTLEEDNMKYASCLENIGVIHLKTKRYTEAETLLLKAVDIYKKPKGKNFSYAHALKNLGVLYSATDRPDLAEKYYVEAKEILEEVLGKEHPEIVSVLNALSKTYATTGNYELADVCCKEYAGIQKKLYTNLAFHLSEAELAAYIHQFEKDLSWLYSYGNNRKDVVSQQVLITSFDNLLFYTGFLLSNTIRIRNLATQDSVTTEKFNLLKSYHRRIAKENTKPIIDREPIDALEEKVNNLEKELVNSAAGFEQALKHINWQDVQAHLKKDEVAIHYVNFTHFNHKAVSTDTVLYAAFVLRPGWASPRMVDLCTARELEAALFKNRTAGSPNTNIHSVEKTRELYQMIWQPLEQHLDGVRKLHLVPSGLLHQVSFAILQSPVSHTLLIDQYDIAYHSNFRDFVLDKATTSDYDRSITLIGGADYSLDSASLATLRQTIPKRNPAPEYMDFLSQEIVSFHRGAVLHDTTRTGVYFDYLPGTQQEVERIHRQFRQHKWKSNLYTGNTALEENIKNSNNKNTSPQILHIASHGFFFEATEKDVASGNDNVLSLRERLRYTPNPLFRSGLVFTGANHCWKGGRPVPGMEDGILTAYEVASLDLSHTELAVLSACNTGLGDIRFGEGVFGLQRAFRQAGVDKLIISLWKVPDEPTAEMMELFYAYYLKGASVRQAFTKAQKKVRKKYQVGDWAAFVLVE